MKKVLYFAALLSLGTLASCQKEDIENTATVDMAGQWYCTVDAVDDAGNPITKNKAGEDNSGVDYFGVGRTLILTYNTAGNTASEMWIDNMGIGNFAEAYADYFSSYGPFPTYTIKTKVTIDQKTLTFRSQDSENFGAGYEWWTVKTDAAGNAVTDKDGNPVEELVHAEKAMPVTIDGKILKGLGKQNNGMPADSIVFFVTYKGDPWYPDDGYAKYKVSGVRYSGLAEND